MCQRREAKESVQIERDAVVPIYELVAIGMDFMANLVRYYLESVVSEKVASSVRYQKEGHN